MLIPFASYIDTQLQLEADAREALPYVRRTSPLTPTPLTIPRHSIIAHSTLVPSDKTFSPV